MQLERPSVPGSEWALLYRCSQERVVLPEAGPGGWLLDFDAETGQAYLDKADDSDESAQWAVDLLKLALYIDDNGVQFLRFR